MKIYEEKEIMNPIEKIKVGLYFFTRMHPYISIIPWLFRLSLLYILFRILYPFIKNKRKEKPVISFDSYYYNGNARAVYEKMKELHPDEYEYYWIARNYKTFKDVRKKKERVFFAYSLLGLSWYLRTDAWVRVQTGIGIFSFLPSKSKVIQLWHGEGGKGATHSIKDFEMHDAWCVPSEFIKKRYIEIWNPPREKLYVTGYARMDFLYNYLKMPREKLLKDEGIKNGRKIILYAPTFDVGLWPWGNAYKEFEKLCKFCRENSLILILRLHPFARVKRIKLKKIIKKYENVYWLDMSKEPDTMKLLAIADVLITSWSSIDNEYFLTKRPIIYLEKDREYFVKKRGKMKIPLEYRAGEIVHNDEEFYEALNIVLKEGNRYKEKQEDFLMLIHGNVDGKASERVVKVIEKLLEKD